MFTGQSWRAHAFGEPLDVLHLEEDSWSEAPAGQVIVRVAAAGIGLPDVLIMRGAYPGVTKPPITPGQEVVGEVVEVAPGSAFAMGDRVMGMTPFGDGLGGCGTYAYVREAKAIRAPAALSDAEAAGFLLAFRTAHSALIDRVPVTAGQSLVILGAAGSSGAAAIQLGKALGATVVAVAGGQVKCEFCRTIGADATIDYQTVDDLGEAIKAALGGTGADILFDPVGGETAASAVKALGRGGRVAMLGYASGDWLLPNPLDMVLRNYSVMGVFAGGYTAAEDAAAYRDLVEMVADGRIRTPVGRIFDFAGVPVAIETLKSPPPGKSIIRIA
jgi:NADPH2:quinone reductase